MSPVASRFSTIIRQFDDKLFIIPDRQQVIRIDVQFVNDSRLVAFEYIYFDTGRTKYRYQWMDATNDLIHRWDNAHPVNLPTSPHHQHIGSEEDIQPSEPMTLEKELVFIASRISGTEHPTSD